MRLSAPRFAVRFTRRLLNSHSSLSGGLSGIGLRVVVSIGLLALTSSAAMAHDATPSISSSTASATESTPTPPTPPMLSTQTDGAALLMPATPSAMPPPPSAAAIYLRTTLHVHNEVALCADALNRSVRRHPRYDRLLQLDRYQLHATLRHRDAIFSIGKPVPVDTIVTMKASARVRGHWQWQPVITRCGLRHGRVIATAIAPRQAPSKPTAKQRPRPNADYVDTDPRDSV